MVGTCTKRTPRRDHGGGEAREIADDAAAERDHQIAALDPRREHRIADPLQADA